MVGSLNIDIIVPVHRLPTKDETITAREAATILAVGGKGANQAIAASRLLGGAAASASAPRARFVSRFGNDGHADMLQRELSADGVDISLCEKVPDLPSGQGIVLLSADGSASSIVVGGSNTAWAPTSDPASLQPLLRGAGVLLLQREVPEHVNEAYAAAAHALGVPVIQDVGGEDRPISDSLLALLDFLSPNESELARLTGLPTDTEADVIAAARSLTARGCRNVLVTLGSRGSLLVPAGGAPVLRQEALPPPGGVIVDATAAGDSFRAAFAVAFSEGKPMQECLRFATAAGAVAVSRMGAAPSLPTRAEVEAVLQGKPLPKPAPQPAAAAAADGSCASSSTTTASSTGSGGAFPLKFASRLNSMKSRRDLAGAGEENDALGWVARQGRVRGLDLVSFNYPQHLQGLDPPAVRSALAAAGLGAGPVCIRFPDEFGLGAFTNPDPELRAEAVRVAAEGCRWTRELGSNELVVWSPFDGYDYHLQVDFAALWERSVESFRALADACGPAVRVSLEFKPTDESTRFAAVPSTGAALLLARDVARANFGLTLDLGHLLMAGENPAQSVAQAGLAGRLFGVQLGDGHSRLGAEDGLAFGSVHGAGALELAVWLRKANYSGVVYFDTFPRNEDPVREAEFNIRRFKALWERAGRLLALGGGGGAGGGERAAAAAAAAAPLEALLAAHDAMGSLELLEREGFL